MVIVTVLYLAIVYLLFFKFKLLPWNGLTKGLTTLVGVIILIGFLVGLQGLTPSSSQGIVTARIVEVAPQVGLSPFVLFFLPSAGRMCLV